jgi:cytochrome P450
VAAQGEGLSTSASVQAARAPQGHPRWGHAREFDHDELTYVRWLAREYGDVVPLRLAPYRVVLFNHPDPIEQVLVSKQRAFVKGSVVHRLGEVLGRGLITSDGELWRTQRRLIQPAFHRERIERYAAMIAQHAEQLTDTWQGGQERVIQQDMLRLTLGIICSALFGVDVEDDTTEIGQAVAAALEAVRGRPSGARVAFTSVAPVSGRLRFWRAKRRLEELVERIVRERGQNGDHGDLVSLLLAARYEDGRAMSSRQIRDEVMTIVLAGHETTHVALSWAWYLLAQHPDVEAGLQAEADAVLGDRLPTLDDLPRLAYTNQVVSEVLRLYPPIWALAREAGQDVEIGGHPIRKGDVALCSQWVMHRDQRYFERPDAFDPERWADGLERRLPRFAYFPFGGGSRQCLGKAFAIMELPLVLATMARRFRLSLVPGQTIAPRAGVTVRPTHGIRMVVHRRR